MISSFNKRMKPENMRDLTQENLTWRNSKGQKPGVMELAQNYLFYRGIKED
jgi:hypothetical protein